ncbi:MAG TPA: PucR family transcriptional regulator ligand-binding domain-containing protein [Candidatus Nanopelagicaceae bacterium]|nr:PucR family transcriptional regulator ligand-binding domain-containing protein [Candidatus Nanopelagicaceae bacterium]
MGLTIQQLTEMSFLQTRYLAGHSGGNRPVVWAHTCELPEPWNWLGAGELLLADGYNFPADAPGQVNFLRKLAQASLSGLALAEGLHAAPLTPEAILEADVLSFPVLETAYKVPFVTVSRTVADSNSHKASASLGKILRIYDVVRRAHLVGSRSHTLLEELGAELGMHLRVLDVQSREPLLHSPREGSAEIQKSLKEMLRSTGMPLPAFMRLSVSGETILVLPIEGDRAVLLAEPVQQNEPLELIVLQHVAVIAGLEVERRAARALRRRENGSRLFRQLLEGSIDLETAYNQLAAVGLGERPWRVICFGEEVTINPDELQLRLSNLKVPHILMASRSELLALLPDGLVDSAIFAFASDPKVRAGISQPIHRIGLISDAVREARWATEAARSDRRSVSIYSEQSAMFFPRTVAEGEAAVANVLGPVLAYDIKNDSELMHSLETYFETNRSWQDGADRLGIHKQTLVYRIRKIEQLTGRKLRDIADQTDLYLALRTWQSLRT